MTTDPKEVRRRGHWCISPDGWYPYCSECHEEPKDGIRTSACPHCGAILTGGDFDE